MAVSLTCADREAALREMAVRGIELWDVTESDALTVRFRIRRTDRS